MDITHHVKNSTTKKVKRPFTLVQPNSVTNAKHSYDERQENIITLIIEAIKGELTKVKPIQTDLFGEPMIRIDTKEVNGNNKAKYLVSAKGMMQKIVSYEWTNPNTLQNIETCGVLITTVHDIKETSIIELTINKWAIPYLLYWGKGVGGTIFNKSIALTLRGSYTKRLYKLCKRWENKGGFSISLSEFREMLCLEDKYPRTTDLKKRVLEPAKEKLKAAADVYFDYTVIKVGGSRSYNQVNFSIKGNNKNIEQGKKTEVYLLCYNVLSIAYPNTKSTKAQDICNSISQDVHAFEKLYTRFKRLKNKLDVGEKSIEEASKLIKHIIKEDYADYYPSCRLSTNTLSNIN